MTTDNTAVGFGWYVDLSPLSDDEFAAKVSLGERQSSGMTRMDLLTAVMHELGHILGLPDKDEGESIMRGTLAEGTRRVPLFYDSSVLIWNARPEERESLGRVRISRAARNEAMAQRTTDRRT